jgi:hypothetical protein
MSLSLQLETLYVQLKHAQENRNRPFNWMLLEELEVLRNDELIKNRLEDLYISNRLNRTPPVTGPLPSHCSSCGKPLP